ncbi:MAG: DNA-3-methyladenine glycosylase I [Treponema sp.]|jgi:DNA-3-methyladenine glycosylase I|nr:DNA-3-methyladenine glycosylase I [Treponema sp.]
MSNDGNNSAVTRCPWCLSDSVSLKYHDEEWGTPVRDSRRLFESLVLDGAQAGLSWITILKRREGYRIAFDDFDPEKVAVYGDRDVARLMADSRIIRNKRKILSAIENARAYCAMPVPLSDWLWGFVDNAPIINYFKTLQEIPATTELSEKISRELKRMGFSFVGPTIVYAFMQAVGMVNDHLVGCFRHSGLKES